MKSGTKTIVNCPTCGKEVVWDESSRWRPFCSERCKLIDLGGWADESNCIPGEELPNQTESGDDYSNH